MMSWNPWKSSSLQAMAVPSEVKSSAIKNMKTSATGTSAQFSGRKPRRS